jgi:outer membrane protein assembly factor BamD
VHFPVVCRVNSLLLKPFDRGHNARHVAVLVLVGAGLALAGCRSTRHKEDQTKSPDVIYQRAQSLLKSGAYESAIKSFEALTARFPFSDEARQSHLDLIYAYYRQHEKESAIDAADTFIRENPTHPRIDYAYYIKGLVYFERSPNFLERWFNVDLAQRPPQDARKSFDAFARVVTQYPASDYAADARQRMIYLRNRLAEYEVHVARYYVRRGAWVASADRARYAIENYDGAPAIRDALEIVVQSYDKLGLTELATDSRKVLAVNYPGDRVAATRVARPWWKIW